MGDVSVEQRAADALSDGLSLDKKSPAPKIAVVLGSGWGGGMDEISSTFLKMPYSDVPGMHSTSVSGHAGFVGLTAVAGVDVLCFSGRSHYYESRDAVKSTFHVRVAAALGVKKVILTNGAGSTNEDYSPGDVVVMKDHINMTADTPLSGPEFVSMTDAYDPAWRARLYVKLGLPLKEGVYMQLRGPSYETPAEVRMARIVGADLVGMSTALETIEARRLNIEVMGLSLVTNYGAGVRNSSPSHSEVVQIGESSRAALSKVLSAAIATA